MLALMHQGKTCPKNKHYGECARLQSHGMHETFTVKKLMFNTKASVNSTCSSKLYYS